LFMVVVICGILFFASSRRHTRSKRDWSSDVCSSDLPLDAGLLNTKDRIKRDSVNAVILKEFLIKRIENIKAGKLNPHIRFEAIRSEERRVGKESRCRNEEER